MDIRLCGRDHMRSLIVRPARIQITLIHITQLRTARNRVQLALSKRDRLDIGTIQDFQMKCWINLKPQILKEVTLSNKLTLRRSGSGVQGGKQHSILVGMLLVHSLQ